MFSTLLPYAWLLWNRRIGVPYLRDRRTLKQQERLGAEAMRRLQWSQLQQLLWHAYEKVPFYRRRFDEAGLHPSAIEAPDDLARLPILTRQDLQQHLEELVPDNVDRTKLIRNMTGGSTGNPVIFYETTEYKARQMAVAERSRSWAGYRPGRKLAIVWGADRDIPTLSRFARFRVHHVLRQRWLNSYNLTEETMEAFARQMIEWKPEFILAYAAALYMFARFLRERGLDRIRPSAIETSAEKLWPYQRELIEDVFKCKVFDTYGSRDVTGVAAECEAHRGLHVLSDNVYVELLRDGRPAEPGEIGEIVVTKLTCPAMPLIRYQIGDLASWSDETCPCGRPFPLLQEIVGRSNDIISTPSGKHVHGAFFNHLFFGVDGVQQFQVYQKTVNDLTISIVSAEDLPAETLRRLQAKVEEQVGSGMDVQLKLVEAIAPTPTGKHRYMISEVGPSFIAKPDSRGRAVSEDAQARTD